jgi:hypothetical protein
LLAQEGMNRAAEAADEGFMRAAKHAVWTLVLRGEAFSTDEVWAILDQTGAATPERRALGAVLKAAKDAGFIASSGSYRKSSRPECHSRPVLVWVPTGKARSAA